VQIHQHVNGRSIALNSFSKRNAYNLSLGAVKDWLVYYRIGSCTVLRSVVELTWDSHRTSIRVAHDHPLLDQTADEHQLACLIEIAGEIPNNIPYVLERKLHRLGSFDGYADLTSVTPDSHCTIVCPQAIKESRTRSNLILVRKVTHERHLLQ